MHPLLTAFLSKETLHKTLDIVDDVIPDKDAARKAKDAIENRLIDAGENIDKAQASVNKVEAGHKSIWVAGWRPAIGWTCALGIFWAFVGQPIATWILALAGSDAVLPDIDTAGLMSLTMGMLGLGGLRTYEKLKGITK